MLVLHGAARRERLTLENSAAYFGLCLAAFVVGFCWAVYTETTRELGR